jgi:hypothetical protein
LLTQREEVLAIGGSALETAKRLLLIIVIRSLPDEEILRGVFYARLQCQNTSSYTSYCTLVRLLMACQHMHSVRTKNQTHIYAHKHKHTNTNTNNKQIDTYLSIGIQTRTDIRVIDTRIC